MAYTNYFHFYVPSGIGLSLILDLANSYVASLKATEYEIRSATNEDYMNIAPKKENQILFIINYNK